MPRLLAQFAVLCFVFDLLSPFFPDCCAFARTDIGADTHRHRHTDTQTHRHKHRHRHRHTQTHTDTHTHTVLAQAEVEARCSECEELRSGITRAKAAAKEVTDEHRALADKAETDADVIAGLQNRLVAAMRALRDTEAEKDAVKNELETAVDKLKVGALVLFCFSVAVCWMEPRGCLPAMH